MARYKMSDGTVVDTMLIRFTHSTKSIEKG